MIETFVTETRKSFCRYCDEELLTCDVCEKPMFLGQKIMCFEDNGPTHIHKKCSKATLQTCLRCKVPFLVQIEGQVVCTKKSCIVPIEGVGTKQ